MSRGTDHTTIASQSAPGASWPPVGGAPQVIVRLPDLRTPKAAAPTLAPTLVVAIDAPHTQPAEFSGITFSAIPLERPPAKLEGPHWGRKPLESASTGTDRARPAAKHPLISQAIGLVQRRAELLLVLAGALLLQIAIQFAWRTSPDAAPAVPTAEPPVAASAPPVPVQSPIITPEFPTLPRAGETVGPPISTAPIIKSTEPVDPSGPPSMPETGTTTEPRDVPPWESWPSQPKANEPTSNQAASNTPAKVSDPAVGPTLAAPRPDAIGARPKSLARLKGTISKPPVEPTHEHARRSLY